MHGNGHLPSHGGQHRGVAVRQDLSIVRPALFTFPPPAPATSAVRLPSLTPSCVTLPVSGNHQGGRREVLREAAVRSAQLRYTSSLKRATPTSTTTTVTRSSPASGVAVVSEPPSEPSSSSPLSPAESVTATCCPDNEEVSSSFSRTSPQAASPTADTTKSPSSSTSLETLLKRQQYVELYFVLSTLLPITSRRLLKEDTHTMRIVGYRAICSCALLRFKESAEDGVACLDIRRRLRQSGCVFSGEDDARFCARVNECVMRALVMSERYEEADAVASSLPGGLSSLSVATSGEPSASDDGNAIAAAAAASAATSTIPTASTWKSAILPLRRFRSAVAARHWRDALSAVDDHATTPGATAAAAAAAMACLRASPLCVMLAFVHLEAGHPMTARALLLAYLAELPEPPTWDALSSALLEHEQLWDSFRSHYVFSTTLLAKASVMSGSAYLNIAAALLQRCLRVLPLYTPARLLAEFVLGYEAQQAALDLAMAKHDFSAALLISSRMLGMPEICPALEAELYLVRMQVQWLRRLPLEVVREASLCIAADPTCALAFRLRADALESMNQAAEAVADRAATAHCSTKAVVEAAFTKLLVQREKYEAAQRTSTTQRWSFTAFAATPAAAAASSHLHGYARENDSDNGNSAEATRTIRGSRTGAGGGQSSFASRNTAKEEPSHYAVLGVSPRATGDEVRQRYRYLTLRCHPDRLVNASAERRAEAAEEFKRVSNAYSVLSDPLQRSEYDATLPFLS